jgi:hypothetical protein
VVRTKTGFGELEVAVKNGRRVRTYSPRARGRRHNCSGAISGRLKRRCSGCDALLKRRCGWRYAVALATSGEHVGDEEAHGLRLLLVVGA